MAIGKEAAASNSNSIAIGSKANASNSNSIAIGLSTIASGGSGVAVGNRTEATGGSSSAFGYESKATNSEATAIGYQSTTASRESLSMGRGSVIGSNADRALAMGYKAYIGDEATPSTAVHDNGVAVSGTTKDTPQSYTRYKDTIAIGQKLKPMVTRILRWEPVLMRLIIKQWQSGEVQKLVGSIRLYSVIKLQPMVELRLPWDSAPVPMAEVQ